MSWLTEPDADWDPAAPDEEPPRSRLRLVALLLGGWLAVSLLVLVVLLVVGGHHGTPSPSTSSAGAGPQPSSSTGLPPGWQQQASDDQTNCAAHAYGQAAAFFARTPCVRVHRLLASASAGGRPVVIATNAVTFASPDQAKTYLALVNSDGTGNISDLLREGVRYPGGPAALSPDAAFASAQDGSTVKVAEAAYASGNTAGNDPTLLAIAKQGV
ncbi:MAG TPA: hypothetical protein VHO01_15800 [Jatrophihabitans sp.]|nr:hypothetical protein [Jatrophihabitans sp.]